MPAELLADDADPGTQSPAAQAAASTQFGGVPLSLAHPDQAPAPAVIQDAAPSVPPGPAAASQHNVSSLTGNAAVGAAPPAPALAGALVCAGGGPLSFVPAPARMTNG